MKHIALLLRPERLVPRRDHDARDRLWVGLWVGLVLLTGLLVR